MRGSRVLQRAARQQCQRCAAAAAAAAAQARCLSSRPDRPLSVDERIALLRRLNRPREAGSTIAVDTSGLFQHQEHASFVPHPDKPAPTALTTELAQRIKARGPITVADYMLTALQHPELGYYTRANADIIGSGGDFTTAPEISQLFAELLCVWCVATWRLLGSPPAVRLVEAGPGKGTLMAGLLRSAAAFPEFADALAGVHMIETSDGLRQKQAAALGRTLVPANEYGGQDSTPLATTTDSLATDNTPVAPAIHWHRALDDVPEGCCLLLAQELLDALPVHQFELTAAGWRERLVDINEDSEGMHFRYVLSPVGTPASRLLLESPDGVGREPKLPQIMKAKNDSTAATADAHTQSSDSSDAPTEWQKGDRIEISPMAMSFVQETAQRVAQHGGAALFIDYGTDHAQADTVRAFSKHKEVDALDQTGLADITADVNFAALRRSTATIAGAQCHGPVEQGEFLMSMGAVERAEALIDQEHVTTEQAAMIVQGMERLIDPTQMGSRYKVFAVTSAEQREPLPGFAAGAPNT